MSGYALLDCGGGRKLERFGDVCVARPAPAASAPIRDPGAWAEATLEFVCAGAGGTWKPPAESTSPWIVEAAGMRFELGCTPAGQVGLFPEQGPLRERLGAWVRARPGPGARVLDLFGYTGGSTLAAASAGASVTYVDGARAMVAWMRRNLALNGLADAPVRSLPEDAQRFVEREVRRERTYDAVVLDPPTFGRGPDGSAFHIERDLEALLAGVGRLVAAGGLVLLTAHTESWTSARLESSLERALGGRPGPADSGELTLRAVSGAELRSGIYVWREIE